MKVTAKFHTVLNTSVGQGTDTSPLTNTVIAGKEYDITPNQMEKFKHVFTKTTPAAKEKKKE